MGDIIPDVLLPHGYALDWLWAACARGIWKAISQLREPDRRPCRVEPGSRISDTKLVRFIPTYFGSDRRYALDPSGLRYLRVKVGMSRWRIMDP